MLLVDAVAAECVDPLVIKVHSGCSGRISGDGGTGPERASGGEERKHQDIENEDTAAAAAA